MFIWVEPLVFLLLQIHGPLLRKSYRGRILQGKLIFPRRALINQYVKIFEANRPMLSHPDKIYPGQTLRIPEKTITQKKIVEHHP
jgi:hypothetical protein